MVEPAPRARLRSGQYGRVQRVPDCVLCSSQPGFKVQPELVPPELTTNCSLAIDPPSTEIKAANESSRNVAITDLVIIAVQISISRCKLKPGCLFASLLLLSDKEKVLFPTARATHTRGPTRFSAVAPTETTTCQQQLAPCCHSRVSFSCSKPKLFCMAVI